MAPAALSPLVEALASAGLGCKRPHTVRQATHPAQMIAKIRLSHRARLGTGTELYLPLQTDFVLTVPSTKALTFLRTFRS
jgi:hypothetical protein